MSTLYYNCDLFTRGSDRSDNYFIVTDGKVESRGYSEDVIGEFDQRVNLNGLPVTPGIGDAHVHVTDLGWANEILDMHSSSSKETFLHLLDEYIKSEKWSSLKKDVNCLEGFGWHEESELPSLEEIDALTLDVPAIFHRRCLHVMFVNSAAIEALKLNDPSLKLPDVIEVIRDRGGKARGILREAFELLKCSYLKFKNLNLQKRYILKGLDICEKAGLTQVHACEEDSWLAWRQLTNENKINIRVFLSIFYYAMEKYQGSSNFPKYPNETHGMVTADRIKLFADGALGAKTAALSLNYKNDSHNGMLLETVPSLVKKINQLHSLGWRLEVHVIGDRSVDLVLDAFELCNISSEEIKKFRHILNHCQMIRADQIPKIIKFGCSCSIQPQFVEADAPWCLNVVPDELHPSLYTWKTFLKKGLKIHGGSDGPVEDILPIEAMRAAMERRNGENGTFMPEECLTLHETIELFTKGVSEAARAEDHVGSLLPGQFADFNVFLSYSVENFKIISSYVNGKRIFHSES